MQWIHKCNRDWLEQRQNYLTATDIKDLIPVTKTGRPRTIDDESYLKVMAKKLIDVREDDCVSTGAAARGHILEPWAINLYNDNSDDKLYHWDDIIVIRDAGLALAFSPDAMNIEQDNSWGVVTKASPEMTRLGEIKSYGPDKHLVCGHTDKKDLEERWQIAVAFAVCDTLEEATLMFYNPSMESQMFTVVYTRADLEDEIKTVLEVEQNWLDFCDRFNSMESNNIYVGGIEEKDIVQAIAEMEDLNPESCKTVIL